MFSGIRGVKGLRRKNLENLGDGNKNSEKVRIQKRMRQYRSDRWVGFFDGFTEDVFAMRK